MALEITLSNLKEVVKVEVNDPASNIEYSGYNQEGNNLIIILYCDPTVWQDEPNWTFDVIIDYKRDDICF